VVVQTLSKLEKNDQTSTTSRLYQIWGEIAKKLVQKSSNFPIKTHIWYVSGSLSLGSNPSRATEISPEIASSYGDFRAFFLCQKRLRNSGLHSRQSPSNVIPDADSSRTVVIRSVHPFDTP
jgi:hypothetical protein